MQAIGDPFEQWGYALTWLLALHPYEGNPVPSNSQANASEPDHPLQYAARRARDITRAQAMTRKPTHSLIRSFDAQLSTLWPHQVPIAELKLGSRFIDVPQDSAHADPQIQIQSPATISALWGEAPIAIRIVPLHTLVGVAPLLMAFRYVAGRQAATSTGSSENSKQSAISTSSHNADSAKLLTPIYGLSYIHSPAPRLLIVTPVAPLGSLANRLGRPIPLQEALPILLDVIRALCFIRTLSFAQYVDIASAVDTNSQPTTTTPSHGKESCHGNLAPENVLIFPEGCKLADFALDFFPRKTHASYEAPERKKLSPPFIGDSGQALDAYAFGALICHVLSGSPVMQKFIPELQHPYAATIAACTDKNPKMRPNLQYLCKLIEVEHDKLLHPVKQAAQQQQLQQQQQQQQQPLSQSNSQSNLHSQTHSFLQNMTVPGPGLSSHPSSLGSNSSLLMHLNTLTALGSASQAALQPSAPSKILSSSTLAQSSVQPFGQSSLSSIGAPQNSGAQSTLQHPQRTQPTHSNEIPSLATNMEAIHASASQDTRPFMPPQYETLQSQMQFTEARSVAHNSQHAQYQQLPVTQQPLSHKSASSPQKGNHATSQATVLSSRPPLPDRVIPHSSLHGQHIQNHNPAHQHTQYHHGYHQQWQNLQEQDGHVSSATTITHPSMNSSGEYTRPRFDAEFTSRQENISVVPGYGFSQHQSPRADGSQSHFVRLRTSGNSESSLHDAPDSLPYKSMSTHATLMTPLSRDPSPSRDTHIQSTGTSLRYSQSSQGYPPSSDMPQRKITSGLYENHQPPRTHVEKTVTWPTSGSFPGNLWDLKEPSHNTVRASGMIRSNSPARTLNYQAASPSPSITSTPRGNVSSAEGLSSSKGNHIAAPSGIAHDLSDLHDQIQHISMKLESLDVSAAIDTSALAIKSLEAVPKTMLKSHPIDDARNVANISTSKSAFGGRTSPLDLSHGANGLVLEDLDQSELFAIGGTESVSSSGQAQRTNKLIRRMRLEKAHDTQTIQRLLRENEQLKSQLARNEEAIRQATALRVDFQSLSESFQQSEDIRLQQKKYIDVLKQEIIRLQNSQGVAKPKVPKPLVSSPPDINRSVGGSRQNTGNGASRRISTPTRTSRK
eukprot:TRINITY_DN10512_c0_g1_i8.p1 TRINITY_DN10512_c0_g1~~TRINITY_DN10512_c0_g1_i8.p1  ORF type:complete len:1123 (+),score=210.03 TRINITY_DN10512_c0_g1_i8:146-3514(+)